MENLFKKVGLLMIGAIMLNACTDDYFEFDKITTEEWRPILAIPLVNTSLTLEDIVIRSDSNGLIKTNADGILEVKYRSTVLSTAGNRVYEVPSQIFGDTIDQPVQALNGGFPLTFDQSFEIEFKDTSQQFKDVIVDSLLLKKGTLNFTIENEYPYNIEIDAKFRTFTDINGDTLKLKYTIPAATSTKPVQVSSRVIDLTNYKINLTEDANGNPAVNTIPIDAKIKVQLVNGVGATNGEELRLIGQISNADFKEFYGYLGSNVRPLEKDTFAVQLFKNFTSSNFFLSNPSLDVAVFNSFSVPINFNFLYLSAINRDLKKSIAFDIPPSLQPLVLNYPAKYGTATTNIKLDRNNSNLDTIVSFLLDSVAFDSEIQFNPQGVPAPGQPRNFLTDTSDIGLDVEFTIPFEGRGAGFFIEDTIDFNFELADDLSSGILRVIAENGFPMEVAFQLTFLDSANNPIDQLFENGLSTLVSPSNVNAMGETISESKQLTDVEISGERLQKLSKARKLAIQAQLSTAGASQNRNIRFQSTNRLGLSIGLKAGILID